jgi:hypothetical protein
VQQGQWVGSVAMRHGFADWQKDVWEHADNAELRQVRKDPHVLHPGDELFVPEWEKHEESCETEKKHTFELKTPSEVLRLQVLDAVQEPVKDAEYTLELEYEPCGVVYKQQNKKTDGDGMLEEKIPSTATLARLKRPSAKLSMELVLGELMPLEEEKNEERITGAQQRLVALGYLKEDPSGEWDDASSLAMAEFQRFCKENPDHPKVSDAGDPDGQLTKKSVDALQKFYGC